MEAVARAKTAITPAAPRVAQVHLKARLLQVAGMVTGLKFLFCNFFKTFTAFICYFGGNVGVPLQANARFFIPNVRVSGRK